MAEETDTQKPDREAVAPVSDGSAVRIRRKVKFTCVCGAVTMIRSDRRQKFCSPKCPKLMELRPTHLHAALVARLRSPKSGVASANTGRQKMADPEFRAKIAAARRNSEKCKKSAERVMAEVLHSSKIVAKAKATRLGAGRWIKTVQKHWILKSPRNQVFEFDNLSQFVRNNASMFDELDTRWRGSSCNATKCLSALRATRRHPINSWKGWTWISITERMQGCAALDIDQQNA